MVSKTGCFCYRSNMGLSGLLGLLKLSQLALVTYEELDRFVSKQLVLAEYHLKNPGCLPSPPRHGGSRPLGGAVQACPALG